MKQGSPLKPLAVSEKKAATLLDLPVARFRRYVEQGALPPPCRIGRDERWRVEDLDAILSGTAARPLDEDFSV